MDNERASFRTLVLGDELRGIFNLVSAEFYVILKIIWGKKNISATLMTVVGYKKTARDD